MSRHKQIEKAMEDKHADQKQTLERGLADQMDELHEKHRDAQKELEGRHKERIVEIDQEQGVERSKLLAKLKRERTEFVDVQQLSADRMTNHFRSQLEQVIERAQNELTAACTSKACVLLTAEPAAGKTCLISQLVMQALSDKNSSACRQARTRSSPCPLSLMVCPLSVIHSSLSLRSSLHACPTASARADCDQGAAAAAAAARGSRGD